MINPFFPALLFLTHLVMMYFIWTGVIQSPSRKIRDADEDYFQGDMTRQESVVFDDRI